MGYASTLSQSQYRETNFDGLVGPTHHYAGLAWGNIASNKHALQCSNPKAAALQGLEKMWRMSQLGIPQGLLPPRPCPDLNLLRTLGFQGDDGQVLDLAYRQAPYLLSAVYSSSSMWAANAATVTPSCDSRDGKVHFTPANLSCQFHRSLETKYTTKLLKTIFHNEQFFTHHAPLPTHPLFGDEGAANHTRLCQNHGHNALHLFVYGQDALSSATVPARYPARQSKQACEAMIRRHQLDKSSCLLIQQNPQAIDQGAFHNDVIAVGNQNMLLYHQHAFIHSQTVREKVYAYFTEHPIHIIEVQDNDISLKSAIDSYLFNSQLITLNDGSMALFAPDECQENPQVWSFLQHLQQSDTLISQVHYLNVKQSMKNGGGPACLRLRVVLSQQEFNAVNPRYWLTARNYPQLIQWVKKHYRDRLLFDDLRDPLLLLETQSALEELTAIIRGQ